MTGIDDIPWGDPVGDAVQLAKPKSCKHLGHRITRNIAPEGVEPVWAETCHRCGHVFDRAKQKQGKSSNRIAKDIERWVGRILHLTRVGQYGKQEDLGKGDEWAFVQVKSGPAWFAERYYREIMALPVKAGRRRALVVADKPGAGGNSPRRAMWIEILQEMPLPGVTLKWEDGQCANCGRAEPKHYDWCVHGR